MKPKRTVQKQKMDVVDKWQGVFEPIPTNPKVQSPEQFNVFSLINGYEKEAREVLEAKGYPTDVKSLLTSCDKDRRIRDIVNMLTYFREVRIYIWMKDAEGAALSMAFAVRCAMLARIRPVEPSINIGESRRQQQKKTRQKRQKWHGLTREQIAARNEKIIAHYERVHAKYETIKPNGFAKNYAKDYHLGPSQIRNILKIHLAS